YKPGYPGESAYNSVVSAALFLTKKPWIDRHKLGLQGHSFGGYETNYIITRTNIFSASASSAGTTNLISEYGQLFGGELKHFFYEHRQGRIGGTLWDR